MWICRVRWSLVAHRGMRGLVHIRPSIALLRVPAHVPVERVAFQLAPGFTANFSREVTVSARPDDMPITDTEARDAGAIEHVSLPSGDARLYPISLRDEALDATLGATLARPATVLLPSTMTAQHHCPSSPLRWKCESARSAFLPIARVLIPCGMVIRR